MEELINLKSPAAIVYVVLVLCSLLLLLVKAGYSAKESGLVRAKNAIHTAVKTITDFCVSGALFWMVVPTVMFGVNSLHVIGYASLPLSAETHGWFYAFLFFQMMLCILSVSVISGAVAERVRFLGFILMIVVGTILIYPTVGYWYWGGVLTTEPQGWLAKMGFIDYGGSTLVHSVGGWMALAAIVLIGPRIGRFGPEGRVIEGHNIPTTVLGTFLIMVGWFGFTGGAASIYGGTFSYGIVLVNTFLAGMSGLIGALGASWYLYRRPEVGFQVSGLVAGLVSVSAGAHILPPYAAVLIGLIAGLICVGGIKLQDRLRIDDAVAAVPIHLFAGIWGTLAISFFLVSEEYHTTPWEQLWIQFKGVAAVGAFVFPASYILFALINRFVRLRVSFEAERRGLNISEQGASTSLVKLLGQMESQRFEGDFSRHVSVDGQTDVGKIAIQYNLILDKFNAETKRREAAVRAMQRARDSAQAANETKSRFLANVSHELRTPLGGILSYTEAIKKRIFGPVGNEKYEEYVDTIYDSSQHLLSLINDLLDLSKIEACKFELSESEVDLNELMGNMLKIVAPQAEDKFIHIKEVLDPALPHLYVDRRALKQVVLNIISNAIKFTPEKGSIVLKSWVAEGGGVAFLIQDNGPGIPEAEIQKVLEPFTQRKSDMSSARKGTGLGLPLAKSLVELHSGRFLLESELGKGTTVTVHFPYNRTVGNGG